jgi:phosphocarrier protein
LLLFLTKLGENISKQVDFLQRFDIISKECSGGLLSKPKRRVFMFSKEVVVRCESGLHNKQATYFVQKANEFISSVWIESGSRKMNAKSLLGIMSLGVVTGAVVTLIANGPDAEAAVNSLEELLQRDVY